MAAVNLPNASVTNAIDDPSAAVNLPNTAVASPVNAPIPNPIFPINTPAIVDPENAADLLAPLTLSTISQGFIGSPVIVTAESIPAQGLPVIVAAESVPTWALPVIVGAESVPANETPVIVSSESIPASITPVIVTSESIPASILPAIVSPEGIPANPLPVAATAESIPVSAAPTIVTPEAAPTTALPAIVSPESIPASAIPTARTPLVIPASATPVIVGAETIPASAVPVIVVPESIPTNATPVIVAAESVPTTVLPTALTAESIPTNATPTIVTAESVPTTVLPTALTAIALPSSTPPYALNHARILYANLLLGSAVATTSGANGSFTLIPNTADRWTLTDTGSITFTLAANVDMDTVCIGAHNLGSNGFSVHVQYSDDLVSGFLSFKAIQSPTDDTAMMFHNAATHDVRRLKITVTGTGSVFLGSIYAGIALQMQRPFFAGHTPITLSATTSRYSSMSEGGNFIGEQIRRIGYSTSADWSNLENAWLRLYFKPFMIHARTLPYYFAWNLLEEPLDIGYCKTSEDIKPAYSGVRNLLDVSFKMVGFG